MEVLKFYNKDNEVFNPSIIIDILNGISDHMVFTYIFYLKEVLLIQFLNLVFKLNLSYILDNQDMFNFILFFLNNYNNQVYIFLVRKSFVLYIFKALIPKEK